MQAPKNGFFYVLDRETGELLSAEPYVPINWAKGIDKQTGRPIENPGVRYVEGGVLQRPGPLGGHNWQPMSYSPRTGLVYIPASDAQFYYAQQQGFKYRPGAWNTGIDFGAVPSTQPDLPVGFLLAWDPVAQKERWRVKHLAMWNGGTLATAGDLVFQGTAEGRFVAYHAASGQKLWEVNVGTGIIASPMTYELDGVQYVSIMAGWGGAGALTGAYPVAGEQPGRLLTFALQGEQALPESQIAQSLPSVTAIEHNATEADIANGGLLFARNCAVCHGLMATGTGGVIADLRLSDPSVFDSYHEIVLGGEMIDSGMPAFKLWLKPEEVDALRAYVVARRNELAAQQPQ
jgi:quinohemoprotein ethanol dehydrogenase